MKTKKYIAYLLLIVGFIATGMVSCKDDKVIDYKDDAAYPPPVLTITSPTTIPSVIYEMPTTVTGSVSSNMGVRDVYCIQMVNGKNGLQPVGNKAYAKITKIDKNVDFSIDIKITSDSVVGLAVVATDVLTKKAEQQASILKIIGIPPVITLNPKEIASIGFNEFASITGTATSRSGIDSVTYTLVQKSPYKKLHPSESITVTHGDLLVDFNFNIKVDSENADAIEVRVKDIDGYAQTAFVDIKVITGIPAGKAYIFENIELAPEYERVITPTQPYLFSAAGVNVGGTMKNVLTLAEAQSATNKELTFAFINIWKNTQNDPPNAASRVAQRGFAFCDAAQLGRGPIGRQCDLPWIPAQDTCCMKLLDAATVAAFQLDDFFATATGNWETYQFLNQLSALGLTSSSYFVNNRINASADNSTPSQANVVAGSYIAIKDGNYRDSYKYGIIQVIDPGMDSDLLNGDKKIPGDDYTKWYTGPGLSGYTYNGVANLYGRKCKLKIILQK